MSRIALALAFSLPLVLTACQNSSGGRSPTANIDNRDSRDLAYPQRGPSGQPIVVGSERLGR